MGAFLLGIDDAPPGLSVRVQSGANMKNSESLGADDGSARVASVPVPSRKLDNGIKRPSWNPTGIWSIQCRNARVATPR
jgi:hypothetical protein